jgi:hypothetical protein
MSEAAPTGASWLVPLADLSMILFVVTGAALAQQAAPATRPREEEGRQTGFVQTVPVAMLTDAPGGTPLAQWLAGNGSDATGLVTIEGHFAAPADRPRIEARVSTLADEARAAGVEPRVVVEPGTASQVVTVFAYDRDPEMAQDLL